MQANRLSAESVRTQLRKILSSGTFARSERLARFLKFTVEQILQGNDNNLKEFVIGVEVFDKTEKYDPRMDPIVRVEARRLREKLRHYYATDGREDSLYIDFPTGGYVPVVKTRDAAPASSSAAPATENVIAVLPFANRSSAQENDYFSDGLTEELINALTRVEGLSVMAWSSAFQLKGKTRDIRRIAEQLRIRAVLEGSVRRTRVRLRITAQLVDASTGQYLWSETYERPDKDIFAIQDEISSAIVGALRIKLTGPASRSLITRYTGNLEAYHLYLKGRFYWNKRNEEDFYKALGFFEQAIRDRSGLRARIRRHRRYPYHAGRARRGARARRYAQSPGRRHPGARNRSHARRSTRFAGFGCRAIRMELGGVGAAFPARHRAESQLRHGAPLVWLRLSGAAGPPRGSHRGTGPGAPSGSALAHHHDQSGHALRYGPPV